MHKLNVKKTAITIMAATIIGLGIGASIKIEPRPEPVSYNDFLEMARNHEIEKIDWTENNNDVVFYTKDNASYKTENPKYEDFKKDILMYGIDVNEKENFFQKYESIIMISVQLLLYIVLYSFLLSKMKGDSSQTKKEKEVKSNIRFCDVAGLEEVKEDLMTVVDFLKNPQKYQEAGAEIPKGVLLYGPPGTGKTLLAKAVAGEAGVGFKAVTGSDFEEKYVGVGASRMRKLFQDAKNHAPCIIFIDEIDSIGGKRHSKQRGDDRQTLNTLLSEMDGFDGRNGVIVIAATNRLEDLDPALTRPGRFDSHFAVNLPETAAERRVIIDLYAENKKFAEDVDFDAFAKETLGSSPAKIKTVLNEAAIIAAGKNNGIINREILDEAWMKQLMEGHLKKNHKNMDTEVVAWHEAGHALASLLLDQDLTKVSIIPSTNGAGGATFISPKKLGLFTKKELEDQIIMLYAGRNAEEILTGNKNEITTGASNDIEKATEIIKNMISEYGMNEKFGMLKMEDMEVKSEFIISEAIKAAESLKSRSYSLLHENSTKLKRIAEELIKKETLTGEEIKVIAGE